MERNWTLRILAVCLAVAGLGMVGCSTRKQVAHNHLHEYRHGYYNPVDGYFHDDHRHATGAKSRQGAYPSARAPGHQSNGTHPSRPRTVTYNYW